MTAPLKSVTISGTPVVGQTLSAVVDPAGATADYQWVQSTSGKDYEDIPGATSDTLVLTSDQLGKTVRCVCTGTSDYTGTVRSDSLDPVSGGQQPQADPAAASPAPKTARKATRK